MERRAALRLGMVGVLAAFVPVERRPSLSTQRPPVNVRDHGALGNGIHDDTQAFQSAIDALPAAGGTVHVPDGSYLLDPVRRVQLRTGLRLDLAVGALLVGKPAEGRRTVLLFGSLVRDVTITGGRLHGSADGSTPPAGTATAFGIDLRGCTRVRIDGVRASGFSRDGFYIGAERVDGWQASSDVTLNACVVENCRRQGVSVTGCSGFHMVGCVARTIGPDLPGSGVDLEPNPDRKVTDAEVRGCFFHDNSGFGIMVGGAGVETLVVADNEIRNCKRGGILVKGSSNAQVSDNRIDGSEPAISVRGRTSGVRLERNVCSGGDIEVVRPATAEQIGNRCGPGDA